MIGKTISHYKILKEIGRGGMGEVYLADDLKLERQVVIKFLPQHLTRDRDYVVRFEREAKAAASLNHPNIVTIYDIIEENDQICIVMEYVRGQTLRDLLTTNYKLPVTKSIQIISQLCEGLSKAHDTGIIHRDIKPANIIITDNGIAKILDFGLAKLKGTSKLTKETSTLGTIHYMSPEQTKGEEVDHRSDIWSLGIVLYEMLTDGLPFKGDYDQAIAYSIVNDNPEPLSASRKDIPKELERIVAKTLSKNPAERYQHMDDLLVDLKSILKEPEAETLKSSSDQRKYTKRGVIRYSIVGALLILLGVFGYQFWAGSAEAIDSIAVLPFSNTANDPELEYLSDGMTESIINNLSKLPSLNKVIARSSVFQYKGKEITPKEVGEELGVKALLISRIGQRGDELSINVELVNTENSSRIWGNQYKRAFSKIFEIQDEISQSISENLRLKLSGEDHTRLTKRYTENSEAYKLYLKGRYFYNKHNIESYYKGLAFYEQAIEIDPEFALAYAGVSDVYFKLGMFEVLPAKNAHQKGVAAAMKGLEIDNMVSEIYVALANHKTWYSQQMDIKGALENYKKALSLNPNDAEANHEYGHLLTHIGRYDEGIARMNRALELEPLSIGKNSCLGQTLYEAGKYEEAINQFKKAIEMDSTYMHPYSWLGLNYVQKEMYDEAIKILQKSINSQAYGPRCMGLLGYIYAVQGKGDAALRQLEGLNKLSIERAVDARFIAWIYMGLGENEKALGLLEKAYDEKTSGLIMLNNDRIFDPLRSDKRYTDLLRKIGFEP
jgi:serine/threonine-protein kinase